MLLKKQTMLQILSTPEMFHYLAKATQEVSVRKLWLLIHTTAPEFITLLPLLYIRKPLFGHSPKDHQICFILLEI